MIELLVLVGVVVVFAAGAVVGASCANDRHRRRRGRVVKVDHGLDALSRVGGGH